MHRIIAISAFALLIGVAPSLAHANELPDLSHLYESDIHLKSVVTTPLNPNSPRVLGASTDTSEKRVVSKKLDRSYTSYWRDLSIKPPKGWSTDDTYDETSFYTYAVNPEMDVQITVERFYTGDTSLQELTEYVEDVCEYCGYEVIETGEVSIGKMKGNYIEATNGTIRMKFLVFVKDEVAYIVELYTTETLWSKYKSIMEKSVKSIKLK